MQLQNQHGNARNITINVRAKALQRDLIDQAASALGKTRSDFMLETACIKAQAVLLEQCYFVLSADKFKTFNELLDQNPTENKALAELLAAKSPWE